MRLALLSLLFLLGCGHEAEQREERTPAPAREPEPQPVPSPEPVAARPVGRVLAEAVTLETRVERPTHDVPQGAPHAIVHLPAGLDATRPMGIVVFLHGWSGCARMLASSGRVSCAEGRPLRTGWGLIDQHDAAGTNSVFVVVQLAFMERTGRPGQLAEPGAFASLLRALLDDAFETHLGIELDLDTVPITLVAHSAGYESALAILEHGRTDVRAVLLLDALYAGADRFAEWLAEDEARTLVSLYTGHASTYRESQRLIELTNGRARVDRSPHPHGAIPREQLTALLRDTLASRRSRP